MPDLNIPLPPPLLDGQCRVIDGQCVIEMCFQRASQLQVGQVAMKELNGVV